NNLANDIAKLTNYEQEFIISGSDETLTAYFEVKDRLNNSFEELQKIYENRPDEQNLLSLISQYYAIYMNYSAGVIDTRQNHDFENARKLLEFNDAGNIKSYIDTYTEQLVALLDSKNAETLKELETFANLSRITFAILTAVAIILTI
ncbi:methyl-accepting chemotaxis protein, partial [Butyricicoccus sp. 1XD8-22]